MIPEALQMAKEFGGEAAVALVLTALFLWYLGKESKDVRAHMAEQAKLQREHDAEEAGREREFHAQRVLSVADTWREQTNHILNASAVNGSKIEAVATGVAEVTTIVRDHSKMDELEHKRLREIVKERTGSGHPFVSR